MSILALYLFLYKILVLVTGVINTYLGYKLFVKGIFNEAGDLNVSFGNKKMILRRAAPGTFFTLFGAIIICFAVFKGLSFELKKPASTETTTQNPPPFPRKP